MNGSAEQALPGIWHAALPYRSTDELEAAACQFAADAAGAGAALFVPCDSPSLSRIRTQLSAVGEHVTWTDTPGPGANPGQLIYAINRFAAQHPGRPALSACLGRARRVAGPDRSRGCAGARAACAAPGRMGFHLAVHAGVHEH